MCGGTCQFPYKFLPFPENLWILTFSMFSMIGKIPFKIKVFQDTWEPWQYFHGNRRKQSKVSSFWVTLLQTDSQNVLIVDACLFLRPFWFGTLLANFWPIRVSVPCWIVEPILPVHQISLKCKTAQKCFNFEKMAKRRVMGCFGSLVSKACPFLLPCSLYRLASYPQPL